MGLFAILFGRGIQTRFERVARRDLFGSTTGWDFDTVSALRRWVADRLANFACPACGARQLRGRGLVVRFGKVRLFRHTVAKEWSGRVHTRDEHYRTVWRVYDIVLRSDRSSDNAYPDEKPRSRGGRLYCAAAGCTWRLDEPGRWDASLLDRYHVFPERLQMVDTPKPR